MSYQLSRLSLCMSLHIDPPDGHQLLQICHIWGITVALAPLLAEALYPLTRPLAPSRGFRVQGGIAALSADLSNEVAEGRQEPLLFIRLHFGEGGFDEVADFGNRIVLRTVLITAVTGLGSASWLASRLFRGLLASLGVGAVDDVGNFPTSFRLSPDSRDSLMVDLRRLCD
jgi:hypothetical protein